MRLFLIESMSPDSPDHSNDRVDSILWMVWSKIESFASPNIWFHRLFTHSKWTSGPKGKINILRYVIFHEYEQDLSSSIARSTDFSDFNCDLVPSGGDGVSVN